VGGYGGTTSADAIGSLLDAKGSPGRTLGKYDPALWCVVEVWGCVCFFFGTAGADSNPDPGIRWAMFHHSCSMCSIYSPSGSSRG